MKLKIVTIIITGVISMGLLSFLTNRSDQKTAKISVLSRFTYSMEYIGDDEVHEPKPEPVPEEFTVKAGDSVCNDCIKILKMSDGKLTFEMYSDFISYTDKEPKRKFTVEKGETLTLDEYGLCDATQTYIITYIE